jgi:hypothetical protein
MQANLENSNKINTIKKICVRDLKFIIEKFKKDVKYLDENN